MVRNCQLSDLIYLTALRGPECLCVRERDGERVREVCSRTRERVRLHRHVVVEGISLPFYVCVVLLA